jgi:hypothetical protein
VDCTKFDIHCSSDILPVGGGDEASAADVVTNLPTRKKRAKVLAGLVSAKMSFSKEDSKWMIIEGYKDREQLVKNLRLR